MQIDLNAALSDAQYPGGAFNSVIRRQNAFEPDCNGFITALVLRSLGDLVFQIDPQIRGRALDCLASCAATDQPGACNFYPPGRQPLWMGPRLANDADDTAVMVLERLKANRLTRGEVIKTTCIVLNAHRLTTLEPHSPPWMLPGVFVTWLGGAAHRNIVDCCVNVNVAALYARLGLHGWRGYAEACALIGAGVEWAGASVQRARSLCPFYPDPIELRYAVEHAVMQGCSLLEPTLNYIKTLPWAQPGTDYQPDRPVCSSAYGGVTWYAPILQLVRHHLAISNPCRTTILSKPNVTHSWAPLSCSRLHSPS